ncbi:MAG: hypothetical protein Q7K71_07230 [Candidatus Omnitrophota bacterium]|nr:hypothetical protein [Candidatus Omnitrophota bacterium]
MSIIHEALKKVQNSLQDKISGGAKSGSKDGWKIIVLVLSAVAVLTTGYVYRQGASSPAPHPVVPKIGSPPPVQVNAVPAPVPETKTEAKPEPKPEYADTLNIHGIMSDPNGNVVLIDNGIYAEGDEVQGVKIIKISLDGIVILKDGKEETIRVGQH